MTSTGTGDPDAPPRASVLMPTYNDGRFIRQAIESIRGQTFADFEFIIVNDGSTDDTAEILAEYARRDGRIRVLTNDRNMGIFASLNRGLDVCRGEYVVRMDADDIAIADRMEKQLAVMDARLYPPDPIIMKGASLDDLQHRIVEAFRFSFGIIFDIYDLDLLVYEF